METVASPTPESPTPLPEVASGAPDLASKPSQPVWWRRAMQSGTGLAVAVNRDHLDVMIVRVRPANVRVLAWKRFAGITETPAAVVGEEISRFLREMGAAHLAAHVLLPREDTIIRSLVLPGVPEKDLQGAVELQMESLHPYADHPVSFGVMRAGRSATVVVGICREEIVDRWISFFAEAGIKLAALRVSADVFHKAVRVLRVPPDGFLSMLPAGGGVEIYGESEARPLYSVLLYSATAQALSRARAELRLPAGPANDDITVLEMESLLPAPETVEEGQIAREHLGLYATALGAATAFPQASVNLLPLEMRKGSNWGMVLPTLVISVVLGLLAVGLLLQNSHYRSEYAKCLQEEVAILERQVDAGRQMDEEGEQLLSRLDRLKRYRQRTQLDMAALLELTKVLPDTAWVTHLDLSRGQVSVSGEAQQAGDLLRVVDASPEFEASSFSMPLQRVENRELFRLRANRERQ